MKRVFVNRVMNKTIMTGSPIREIAIMFDKKIPEFISDIVSIVDRSSKVELMSWIGFDMIGKWDEDYYNENKHDLLVYLAAEIFEMTDFVQKEGYAQYEDYLIYIFFFTQYRKLTGKNLRKDMSFDSILLEYQKIDNIVSNLQNDNLINVLNNADILYNGKDNINDLLDYLNIILFKKQVYEPITIVEETKKKIQNYNNYEMCIDYLLMNSYKVIHKNR